MSHKKSELDVLKASQESSDTEQQDKPKSSDQEEKKEPASDEPLIDTMKDEGKKILAKFSDEIANKIDMALDSAFEAAETIIHAGLLKFKEQIRALYKDQLGSKDAPPSTPSV